MVDNEHLFLKRKPRKCPKCGFSPVASILYGLPALDEELERKLNDKSLALGGCVVDIDDPKWKCTSCDTEFYAWNSFANPAFFELPE